MTAAQGAIEAARADLAFSDEELLGPDVRAHAGKTLALGSQFGDEVMVSGFIDDCARPTVVLAVADTYTVESSRARLTPTRPSESHTRYWPRHSKAAQTRRDRRTDRPRRRRPPYERETTKTSTKRRLKRNLMAVRTFTTDELKELDVPYETVHDEVVGYWRHGTHNVGIFEADGKHWKVHYLDSPGADESCDPWNYAKTVDAVEVEQVPVTSLAWREVPEPIDAAITPEEIAQSLTAGDGDYDDGRQGWWSIRATGPVVSGTFTPPDIDGEADNSDAVEWHAVVVLGPPVG